mmetsp:Transcript_20141/g.47959  ORF Transcript_20141/g.47959 Transcript_20141/m.47959 type:complete len:220 (+) Transcript_20141:70-729(+)
MTAITDSAALVGAPLARQEAHQHDVMKRTSNRRANHGAEDVDPKAILWTRDRYPPPSRKRCHNAWAEVPRWVPASLCDGCIEANEDGDREADDQWHKLLVGANNALLLMGEGPDHKRKDAGAPRLDQERCEWGDEALPWEHSRVGEILPEGAGGEDALLAATQNPVPCLHPQNHRGEDTQVHDSRKDRPEELRGAVWGKLLPWETVWSCQCKGQRDCRV